MGSRHRCGTGGARLYEAVCAVFCACAVVFILVLDDMTCHESVLVRVPATACIACAGLCVTFAVAYVFLSSAGRAVTDWMWGRFA